MMIIIIILNHNNQYIKYNVRLEALNITENCIPFLL